MLWCSDMQREGKPVSIQVRQSALDSWQLTNGEWFNVCSFVDAMQFLIEQGYKLPTRWKNVEPLLEKYIQRERKELMERIENAKRRNAAQAKRSRKGK